MTLYFVDVHDLLFLYLFLLYTFRVIIFTLSALCDAVLLCATVMNEQHLANYVTAIPALWEVRLSHNDMTADGITGILRAVAQSPSGPPTRPGVGKVPVWLRMECNGIADPDRLVLGVVAPRQAARRYVRHGRLCRWVCAPRQLQDVTPH